LILSVPPSAALTGTNTSVAVSAIAGSLGATSVTDNRGGTAGWVVSGASTVFTGAGLSISSSVTYSPLTIVKTGIATVTPAAANTTIDTEVALLSATAVIGNNTASWAPGLTVNMPAGSLAGDYAGTVTTSIA
jgi:hypothetical protein